MDDLNRIKRAIIAADKAGDAAAARALVARYRQMTSGPAVPASAVKNPSGGYAMPSLESDMGFGQTLGTAAWRGKDKLVAGAKQAYNWATGNDEDQAKLAEQQNANDAAYAGIQRNRPITTAVGEALPGAALTAPIGGGAGLVGAVIRGGIQGAAPGLLSYGDAGERLKKGAGGAVGGAAFGGIGYGVARAIQPMRNQVRIGDDAAKAAERIRYPLSPGDATGNPMLQGLENYMSRVPGSSSRMGEMAAAKQSALNRAAAKAIGESSDVLDEDTMGAAVDRLGAEFSRLNRLANPDLSSSKFINAIAEMDDANRALKSMADPQVSKLVDQALDLAADGKLSGKEYQRIRSSLGKKARSAGDNQELRDAYKRFQRALDDAADETLSPADFKALQKTRRQYSDYKILDKGMAIEGGDVSAKRVASALKQAHRGNFNTGRARSELMDIARVGRGIKPAGNPNSAAVTIAEGIKQSPIMSALTAPANRAVSNVYLSPFMQRYLARNGLPPLLEQALIRGGQSGGLLGMGAAYGLAND